MNDLEQFHIRDVRALCRQVKSFYKRRKQFRIYHGTTNSTRTQKFTKDSIVDIGHFNRILSLNIKDKYLIVEPNVPMDQLVSYTLSYGLVPPVVMEFPGITVGGGVQGGAGESSSFKWGGFHHTCLEYEIVLGNGDLVYASSRKNAALYWGTACSYGTLGIITKVKLRLVSAKKYIRLSYHSVNGFRDAISLLEKKVLEPVDFIDGILFSKKFGVVMTGTFSDTADLPIVTFRGARDDWFYLHAESIVKKHSTWEELIPIEDYLFRYNRGAFWVGKYAFIKGKVPFNRVTRFLFDPLFQTRTLYRFLQAINISQKQIVQDFILPRETVLSFLSYIDKVTKIYPLWLLPGKLASTHDRLSPGYINTKMGIDVGVWGKVRGDYASLLQLNRDIEKKLHQLGGRKVLYAHAYYPRNEFWQIYDEKWYVALRKKYHAEAVFPDIYEKTRVSERYEVSFWTGLWNVLRSPFRLPVS